MDNRPIMIDAQNVKKKYVIRHNYEKPDSASEKVKLAVKKIIHPSQRVKKEDFYALNGITFQVRQGEKIGIIGKNGAGKSTLLKILSRITEPSDGRIELLGKVSAMLEVGTGFNGELTGRENIYLNGAILGMTKEEIDSKFDDIVDFSEVGKFIDTPVKRYSSGMFVRLAFAVASHLDPDILIVDEVLSVGDTRFQRKCISRMMDIANSGKTILYVSHQMQTVKNLCDRVIVLKEGKIIFDGDVDKGIEIYTESIDISKTVIDVKDRRRRGNHMAVIENVEILDKNTCSWNYTESIRFKIKIKANDDCDNVRLEFIIRGLDVHTIAKAESPVLCKMEKGKVYEFEMTIKNENILAPDKYIASMDLWNVKDGIITMYDVIAEVFNFEITDGSEEESDVEPITWIPDWMGHTMIPMISEMKTEN